MAVVGCFSALELFSLLGAFSSDVPSVVVLLVETEAGDVTFRTALA